MILVVDVGNTNVVAGISDNGNWAAHWRISTDCKKTVDEYTAMFYQLLSMDRIAPEGVEKIVLSSVVPDLTGVFIDMINRVFGKDPLVVTNQVNTGLADQQLPPELGSDLLANTVAAYHRFKRDAMIIDFGTALTFITVSHDGFILGVALAPGIITAVNSLSSNTAQLPKVALREPPSVLGMDTVTAIQSGVLYGYAGLVTGIIVRTESAVGRPLFIIATGGMASVAKGVIGRIDHVDPWHTLEGLRIIADLN